MLVVLSIPILFFSAVRGLAEEKATDKRDMLNLFVHIASENNFPTAAGLASSAAGYACLGKNY